MDGESIHTLPAYDLSAPSAPGYEAYLTLAIDPSGLFIKSLPSTETPLYTFSQSMLKVHQSTSIHVKKSVPSPTGTEPYYAIGEHFISPLNNRNSPFTGVTAARSHGMLVTLGAREIFWDFSKRVPLPPGSPEASERNAPVDPVYTIGTSAGPGTIQRHLLQFNRGKWVNEDDEVVALERETGRESESQGMPVLSVMKELDAEWLDFLVAAWCVTLWGEVGKRVRRLSKGTSNSAGGEGKERKFSFAGFRKS